MKFVSRHLVILILMGMWAGIAGCGALGEAALQGGEATLRTLVDIFLTDFANQVADAFEEEDAQQADDDAGEDDTDAEEDTDTVDDTDTGDDAGAAGQTLYTNNCAACHGSDGSGGFASEIQGLTVEEIGSPVNGEDGHMTFDLTDEEIADIAAFLE